MSNPPSEPSHSCPAFNRAIEFIEEARDINSSLREWGWEWKERAEQLEEELREETGFLRRQLDDRDEQIEAKDREIAELQQRVAELKSENSSLEAEVSRMTDWADTVGPR